MEDVVGRTLIDHAAHLPDPFELRSERHGSDYARVELCCRQKSVTGSEE